MFCSRLPPTGSPSISTSTRESPMPRIEMLVPAGGLGIDLEAGQLRHDLVGRHRGLRVDLRLREC